MNEIGRRRHNHLAAGIGLDPLRTLRELRIVDDFLPPSGRASTLTEYVRALKALGVERYDSYLADGHSEYFGQAGYRLVSAAEHEVFLVAEASQRETFLQHLSRHELGRTT